MKNKDSIVLLCGLLCKDIVWRDIAKELEDDFDITIISFEGYDTIESMAKKVLDVAPSKFILIGHSMGGRVAIEVYRKEPNRVIALGLFNTGVHPKKESEIPGRLKLLDIAKNEGLTSLANVWLPPMMSKKGLSNSKMMEELTKMVESNSYEEFKGQINALINRPDARTILPSIKIPTLLLSGSEDSWSPFSQHEEMAKKIKNHTLVNIINAGHMAPTEEPQLIANKIKDFLLKDN